MYRTVVNLCIVGHARRSQPVTPHR